MKRLGYFRLTKVKKLRECLAAGRLTDLIVPLETAEPRGGAGQDLINYNTYVVINRNNPVGVAVPASIR